MENKNKRAIIAIVIGIFLLLGSFVIYQITSADSSDNRVTISTAKFISIKTGSGNFNDDGLDYSDSNSYSKITDYTAGNDSNAENRIVRSFDTITYDIEFNAADKDNSADHENRIVNVTVELSEEESKFISFDVDENPGALSHTFSFDGIDTYGPFTKSITLYVLGASNGKEISPKFTIKESTDEEAGVVLGKNADSYNYSYEDNQYETVSHLNNYFPTVVSSTNARLLVDIEPYEVDSQKANYNGANGRFMTYVAGLYIEGDETYGLMGKTMPSGNITFDVNLEASNGNVTFNSDWARLYSIRNLEEIESVSLSLPYSTNDSNRKQKEVANPGSLSIDGTANPYRVTISDYNINYNFPTVNANDTVIPRSKGYIGTYAITLFSSRNDSDGKNDINATMTVNNLNATNLDGVAMTSVESSRTLVNEYYKSADFSLKTDLITADTKNSLINEIDGNTVGSASKGSNLIYKTTFKHKETGSTEGLKEVIKVNNNAFRVMPRDTFKDLTIEAKCGDKPCTNLDENSFEVKYVSGTYAKDNYSLSEISSRISSEDRTEITNACSNIDYDSLTADQVLNLYGGPCIKANDNVELVYDKITDAVDANGNEVPITKVIIQTKSGVILPDDVEVTVELSLRVRNVQDLTRTYQVVTVASTSDYDEVLRFYAPNSPYQLANPNNYELASIYGNSTYINEKKLHGANIRIANYTGRQEITVLNKNSDGSMKINYNAVDNETITFNIKTFMEDFNENVGADDVWYIQFLRVAVDLPEDLVYVPDADLGKYLVQAENNRLVYDLPFTKANMEIPDIQFKAKLNPKLNGAKKSLIVTSATSAINVNGEVDSSMFADYFTSLEIFGNGINNVVVEQKIGTQGTIVEKDAEFTYLLRAYNNTEGNVTDYAFVDILPSSGDTNGSLFGGSYQVKLKMPESLATAKVYCSVEKYASLKNEIINENNNFVECNLTENYVGNVTAIKIDNIPIERQKYTDFIELSIKPSNNNYSDVYSNSFIGGSESLQKITSNKIDVKVVSRTISGCVFIDKNEDGVKDDDDLMQSGIPATLYKLNADNEPTAVKETTTDEKGNYVFKDLDVGRYYIDLNYNSALYDLTLRYATENQDKDSDAYKASDTGIARISNKRVPNDPDGIRLTRQDIKVENMDAGLIPRRSFGFEMKKYITRIDLSYNGNLDSTRYNNVSRANITVRNSANATAKVYYGIAITNDSTQPGYAKEIQEDIPAGLIFDGSYEENQGWVEVNNTLKYTGLADDLIMPGETRYIQIVLFMPSRKEAGTFVNNVSIVSMEKYNPTPLAPDTTDVASKSGYEIGEGVTYVGKNWHVIDVQTINDEEQKLTLLADSGTITPIASEPGTSKHGNGSDVYRWSSSYINQYLNDVWPTTNSLDLSTLYDVPICDDASGLPEASYGGNISGSCQTEMYTSSKVRLLSVKEYDELKALGLSDYSWLEGNGAFWTQSSQYVVQHFAEYVDANNNIVGTFGVQDNSVSNMATFINGTPQSATTSTSYEVRPVITISSKKIIYE